MLKLLTRGLRTGSPRAQVHSGDDWADAGLGPNLMLSSGQRHALSTRVRVRPQLVLDEQVAQRFNAYAAAAFPREIGGLLRILTQADGSRRAVDVRIFPHLAASSGYFELDGVSVAQNNLDLLRTGRKEEIPEWCSLIHSHPRMPPFLSGTDRENVQRLAGPGHAYSVICSANSDPAANYFAWHYAQRAPVALLLCDLSVRADPGHTLAGVAALSSDELDFIAAEVDDALAYVRRHGERWWGADASTALRTGAASGRSVAAPERSWRSAPAAPLPLVQERST